MALLERIRPSDIESQCRALLEADLARIDRSAVETVPCVACRSGKAEYSFDKQGFHYIRCAGCGTLYLSPRLTRQELERFFVESKGLAFWGDTIYPSTIEPRRRIIRERTQLINRMLTGQGMTLPVQRMLEIGPGFGLFLECARQFGIAEHIACAEPAAECVARIRRDGLADAVHHMTLEHLSQAETFDLIVANGVMEQVTDLKVLFEQILRHLTPNGRLVVCSASGDGLDSQVLRDLAPNVEPPQNQNFVSRRGWEALAQCVGLRMTAFESRGELDVELLQSNLPESDDPLAAALLARLRSPEFAADFQELLRKHSGSGFSVIVFGR